MKLFVDTGPLVARVYRPDAHHRASIDVFRRLSAGDLPYRLLYPSNFVVDEVLTRLLYEGGHAGALQGLRLLRDSTVLRILHVTEEDEREADRVFSRFSDQRISYTDCTSKVLMDRHGIATAFSFDRDFEIMGCSRIP